MPDTAQQPALPRFLSSPQSSPPADLAGWLACFDAATLPVQEDTALAIEDWRAREDDIDVHLLSPVLGGDPLMTVKLFAHVAQLRHWPAAGDDSDADDGRTEAETVTAALLLLGMGPFFRAFAQQQSAEAALLGLPDAALAAAALCGWRAVLRRAHRASNFAAAFAMQRMDGDVAAIHAAALLHDVGELLLWLRAPALALRIAQAQRRDSRLRSDDAQRAVLGITLPDLQQALMKQWRLPALLVTLDNTRHADCPQARCVALAVRLARHTALGWDNAALPDDITEIGNLLQLGNGPVERLLRETDTADAAQGA